ncbi:MAG TPA: SsgA family sporulation/cell division regulator [Candidatus Saccharimonadales bacterium]|nr:SsgA family sporulation/cell division regulator [Candidatus Saccharimonadales bacterium]
MTRPRPLFVEVETNFRLIASNGTAYPVSVNLHYDMKDPYAIHILFRTDNPDEESVIWTFAREILASGVDGHAGIGDVQVWPWASPRGNFVMLALSSNDGNAQYEVPRRVVTNFLRATYMVVPLGRETDHLNVDDMIRRLLSD